MLELEDTLLKDDTNSYCPTQLMQMHWRYHGTESLTKIMQDPLILFIVIGTVIFTAFSVLKDNNQTTISVSSEARAHLVDEYQAVTGEQASPNTIVQLEKNYITDEILFRHAISTGMHLIDPATRSSLIEKMRFRISALITHPSEADLINFYVQNIQHYYTETSLSFEHLFFKILPKDPQILLAKLQLDEVINGDLFLHGKQFNDTSEGMLRGIFGNGFLEKLQKLELNRWEGPLSSVHGQHYIRLQDKKVPRPMSFTSVKNAVTNDLMQSKIEQTVESKVKKLVVQYEINIEP